MKGRRLLQERREDSLGEGTPTRRRTPNGIRPSSAKAALGLAAICAMASLVFAASASAVEHLPLETFGGSAQPLFSSAEGIAVNELTGDVYVLDTGNSTVTRYKSNGEAAPFSALGSNVIDGTGAGDETPAGGFAFSGAGENQIAVDSSSGPASGDLYVTQAARQAVYIFSSTGEFIGQLTEGQVSGGFPEPCGVAVDKSGTVYVGNFNQGVSKFVPSGNPPVPSDNTLLLSGVTKVCNVAAGTGSSTGKVFAAEFNTGFPVVALDATSGSSLFTLAEGTGGHLAVDPADGHVYVPSAEGIAEYAGSTSGPSLSTITASSEVVGLTVDGGSRAVYVARSGSPTLELSPPGPFIPVLRNQSVGEAVGTEATVEATINPEGTATSYLVEYGTVAGYGSVSSTGVLPADNADHRVSVRLAGLSPATTYHFRFSATNSIDTSLGSDRTFLTFQETARSDSCGNSSFRQGPAARLADCRAYEMVTPVDKNNLDIATLLNLNNNELELDQSATSGEKLTYTTLQGFGDAQSAPYVSQYIASRTPGGWSSESITPPQGRTALNPGKRLELEFQFFSPDLCLSLLNHYSDPPLAPGAFEEQGNAYRRTNCGAPGYEIVSSVPPPPGEPGSPGIQGLSEDEHCALFVPLANGLYENCAGHTSQINLLPDGSQSLEASVGSSGTLQVLEQMLRFGHRQHAISSDGSRVYWSSVFSDRGGPLYVRENAQQEQSALGAGSECLEPAMACTIPVSEENAIFWAASPDGSRAIYSVEQRGGGGGTQARQQLYEFDLATEHSTLLASEVLGVMGVDEQADRTYFVSLESIQGQGTAGEPNLYLFDSTKAGAARYKFIATVSQEDGLYGYTEGKRLGMVQQAPSHRVARVSPDGLHAVFASYAPLTGVDNTDAVSGEADFEVFVYDALGNGGSGSLACISCNPSGQRPRGIDVEVESEPHSNPNWAAALIPPYTTSFYGPRAMSNDGERVFFDSYDALLPADNNGREDVYEWEAPGSGPSAAECTEASASFSPPNDGCLSLISSGESPSGSEFVDASPDGRDVYFKTAASLVPQDPGLIDIYDAREEGGFPPPPGQSPSCEGEACQGPFAPPDDQTPASATFNGPGNAKPKKCPKGKVRSYKHGEEACIKKQKTKKKKSHKKHRKNAHRPKSAKRRTSNGGGAGR
jgi:hypothetical protein